MKLVEEWRLQSRGDSTVEPLCNSQPRVAVIERWPSYRSMSSVQCGTLLSDLVTV